MSGRFHVSSFLPEACRGQSFLSGRKPERRTGRERGYGGLMGNDS